MPGNEADWTASAVFYELVQAKRLVSLPEIVPLTQNIGVAMRSL